MNSFNISDSNKSWDDELLADSKSSQIIEKVEITMATKELAKRAVPAFFGTVFKHMIDITNIFFSGKISSFSKNMQIFSESDIIAGVGLGLLSYNALIFSVSWGMSSTIDTLASQAFGNKKYHLCGYYLNRYRVVSSVVFIFQLLLLYYIGDLLEMIGQPEEASRICQTFIRYQLVGLYCSVQFEGLRRYLIAQGVYNVIVYIQAACFCLHISILDGLHYNSLLTVESLAFANLVTNVMSLILLTIFCMKTTKIHREAWHYSLGSFEGLKEFIRYAIPSTLMRSLEYWVCEILMIFSGWCGSKQQAAAITAWNIYSAFYRFTSGISMATSNLVGNCLGNNDPRNGKQYAIASMLVTCIPIIFTMSFLYFLRYQIMSFSGDQTVIEIGAKLFLILMIINPTDFLQSSLFGVMVAMGYQKYGSLINIFSYFLFLIPLAYILGITYNYGVIGIFSAWIFGSILCTGLVASCVFLTDWHKLALKIQSRLSES
ncbi:unnamed protein product [Moneuplotes crassus]|uniref:MATE efflux family protein n=1 Tax=Euplotes crassus TaxID=5936 RepID=A0AAD1UAP0_EUPCR|nr:unnamed protein product [Moneuplotes crassus]